MSIIIYVALLNEGTEVLRPVKAVKVDNRRYKIIDNDDYNPDLEEWEFEPGSFVECRMDVRSGQKILVAMHRCG